MRGYYDRFSNSFLWPVLHSKQPALIPTPDDWEAYSEMNRRFADSLQKIVGSDDVIWIHDYHLMLLPAYLRQAGVHNRIGYFLHVPFPEPQYWRDLPYACELADGIAQADLVGMQTHKDVKRLQEYLTQSKVRPPEVIDSFPIGIDYEAYHSAAKRPAVRRMQQAIKRQMAGKKIIFSLSRMDYTKGIITQLRALEKFLSNHPHKYDIVYKLIAAPSREGLPEYSRLGEDIKRTVKEINASLGNKNWQPVDYEYKTMGFEEVTAWYGVTDLMLLLPDADGMNLIAKEYIATRQDDDGMAVLSTAMGSAEQLRDALLVPPADKVAAALAIGEALAMPAQERQQRWRNLRSVVRDENIFWWADKFLAALSTPGKKS
ncbi:MAG TPA: trehalose-6-phosphate synthase, partial [Candidatus Saccharimonadales bacterium]